jgi:hypothetical protein
MDYNKRNFLPNYSVQKSKESKPNSSVSPSSSSSMSLSPSLMSYKNPFSSFSSRINGQSESANANNEKTYCSVKYLNLCGSNSSRNINRMHQNEDMYLPRRYANNDYKANKPEQYDDSTLRRYASTLSINLGHHTSCYRRRTVSKTSHKSQNFWDLFSNESSSTSTICNLKSKCVYSCMRSYVYVFCILKCVLFICFLHRLYQIVPLLIHDKCFPLFDKFENFECLMCAC